MSFAAETVFISYSRSDGRTFAEGLERRLADEGIHSWRDLKSMGAGDIRPQVLRAIEDAKHLVLILSRRALVSDWIKREWSHARLVGKRVSPVLADPTLNRADLPAWMKREEVFDIDPARDRDAERWKALVLGLRGDGRVKRTPYMPGDLSADFVPRPAEYEALKAAVLAEAPRRTVALTTALRGAGGYGKTTLASALCVVALLADLDPENAVGELEPDLVVPAIRSETRPVTRSWTRTASAAASSMSSPPPSI